MTQPVNIREHLMTRLVSKHGMDPLTAAAAWEEYLLFVLAQRICREPAGLRIEDN